MEEREKIVLGCRRTRDSAWRENTSVFPAELQTVLAAFDSVSAMRLERRTRPRLPYRFRTTLWIVGAAPGAAPHVVFTRDVNEWGVGFMTRRAVPVGRDGNVALPLRLGPALRVDCTAGRCRPFLEGWHEGVLLFVDQQAALAEESIDLVER